MNWIERLDSFWKGFIIGLVFPGFLFFMYWLFTESQIGFPVRFVNYLINGQLLSNVIKLCGLGNLLLFYFGLNKKIDNFSKGVITSVIVYVALVGYITYTLE